ncbi:hypothetical protein OGAPHI_000578 [Ogataea philodendri]|uniref:Uncharacterized protein n=1 Tax=Ogataea philodendri TaxID=1378263 RepID=A0A9P8PFF2_9ASCO|nr:uncharacterized protein OGAPHI_000578 [Ogataea philodendri]KAH3670867.1 hypothetical protein OGAPHI_000578 [Ogataea philodendri]
MLSGGASGLDLMVMLCFCRLNSDSMSKSDCFSSRYTEPKKLRGTDSWNTSWLINTKSPTVNEPAATPWHAMYIMAVKAEVKIRFWPEFKNASDVATLMEAFL